MILQATRWFAEAASRGFAPTVMDPKYPTPKSLPSPAQDSDPVNDADQTPADPANGASPEDGEGSTEKVRVEGAGRIATQVNDVQTPHETDTLDVGMGAKKQLRAVKLSPVKQAAASKV